MGIRIFGASDDLIEIEGDIREEFTYSPGDRDTAILGISNGLVLEIHYDNDGEWRIRRKVGDESLVSIVQARGEGAEEDEDGCPGYSDKAVIEGDVAWVVMGSDWARVRTPLDRLQETK